MQNNHENDETNDVLNVCLSPLRTGPAQLSTQKSAITLINQRKSVCKLPTEPKSKDVKASTTVKAKSNASSKNVEKERLEDQMNYEHLMTLEKIFYDANSNPNSSDGLDMDQFRVALKKTMGHDIDDRELDKIFMKVDTNCDGTVDWDEYLSYMLLEYQEKQSMFNIDQEHPLPTQITPVYTNHSDVIVSIRKMQGVRSTPGGNTYELEADDQASRYLSLSKDGCLSLLTSEWNLHRTAMIDGAGVNNNKNGGNSGIANANSGNNQVPFKNPKNWLSDFISMPNCNLIATGGTEYEVVFFSTSGSLIQKKFAFTQLGDCALTLDFWFDWKDSRKCALVWGDTRGCITIVRFNDIPSAGLFSNNSKQNNNSTLCIPLPKICAGCFPNVICQSFKVHTDWVRQVKFFTQPSDESNVMQIISCCVADDTALCFSDYVLKSPSSLDKVIAEFRKSKAHRTSKLNTPSGCRVRTIPGQQSKKDKWQQANSVITNITHNFKQPKTGNKARGHVTIFQQRINHIQLRKGILCFDFDCLWNLIVTGSRDCDIRVWNAYVQAKSSTLLKGHKTAVTQIMVNSNDHMVISISVDKNIRMWDLRDYSCRQTIHGRNLKLGRMNITAAYWIQRTKEIVLGTTQLGRLEPKNTVSNLSNRCITSHGRPITAVLYNPLFDEVVTASEDAMVGVWDIRTGQKQMLFTVEKDVEITALAFDSTQRRLITGSRNGMIRVWNFNNGACLRRLKSDDNVEVSSIVCPKQYIVSAGWNKKLSAYLDSYTNDTVREFRSRHTDDILSLAYHEKENILASSSYDGDILIWSLETEDAVLKFNVFAGPHALPMSATAKTNNTSMPECLLTLDAKKKQVIKYRDALLKDVKNSHSHIQGDGSERAVYSLIMLESRKVTEKTAVLISAGVNCFVQAWSIHQRGGLVGRFLAGKKSNESILALATNKDNSVLITGDSSGYLKIWDIANYCKQKPEQTNRQASTSVSLGRRGSTVASIGSIALVKRRLLSSKDKSKLDDRDSIRRQSFSCSGTDTLSQLLSTTSNNKLGQDLFKQSSNKHRSSDVDVMKNVCVDPPMCKVSFRAHTKAVTSIAVNESRNIMITGSTDSSVRIWTMSGRYVGTLGQKQNWILDEQVIDLTRFPQIIPDDVRRVASANTLRTIKGGVHTQWKTVKNALAFLKHSTNEKTEEKPAEEEKKNSESKMEVEKEQKDKKPEAEATSKPATPKEDKQEEVKQKHSKLGLTDGESLPLQKRRPSVTTVWMDDIAMKTIMEYQPIDKVEQCYLKFQEQGVTSSILGKNFWKKRHRRERAPLSKCYERISAPGNGPRPPLAPVAQLTLNDKPSDYFTVSKHNPVRWEAKHAIVYSRLPFATLEKTQAPKIGVNIANELGRSDAVKKWQDGSFEQIVRKHTSSGETSNTTGTEKLVKLANKAKHVQKASNILKRRIGGNVTGKTDLETLLENASNSDSIKKIGF